MDRQQSIEVTDSEDGRESEEFIEKKEKVPTSFAQVGTVSFPGFYGKHRLQASISNLNNQINILQVNSHLISLIYILVLWSILFNLQKLIYLLGISHLHIIYMHN